MVGPAGALAGALTRIVNGPNFPLFEPSLAMMVMRPLSPTSPVAGVPESVPVVMSKVVHDGCPSILNVTTPLLAVTLGRKEYLPPTITPSGGTPCKKIWELTVPALAAAGVASLAAMVESLLPEQPERLAAMSNPRINRCAIFRKPL